MVIFRSSDLCEDSTRSSAVHNAAISVRREASQLSGAIIADNQQAALFVPVTEYYPLTGASAGCGVHGWTVRVAVDDA